MIFSLLLLILAPRFEKETVRKLALTIKEQVQTGDLVVNYRNYNQDLLMYWQPQAPLMIVEDWDDREVMAADNWHHDLDYGMQQNPAARSWLISEQEFVEKLKTAPHVYVLANHHDEVLLNKYYHLNVIARTKKNILLISTDGSRRITEADVADVLRLARKSPQAAADKR